MLSERWASWNFDKFLELSAAVFTLGRFEIGDVYVGTFAEVLPLPLQLKRRNPSGQQAADDKHSGSGVIATFVHVRIHVVIPRFRAKTQILFFSQPDHHLRKR